MQSYLAIVSMNVRWLEQEQKKLSKMKRPPKKRVIEIHARVRSQTRKLERMSLLTDHLNELCQMLGVDSAHLQIDPSVEEKKGKTKGKK